MNRANPVAFVTGASRGIGKAGALALADAGYDVVITARTVQPGDKFDYAATAAESGSPRAMPGSLEETADEIRKRGGEPLPIRLDLMDRATLAPAVEQAIATWGQIDVLYNNGIYQGAGVMDTILDLTDENLERVFEGNFLAQFHLTKLVLPHMLERGAGAIVNMTSTAAVSDPDQPTGEGGWGFGYGASKGALHRMAGMLHVELNHRGIRAYNIDPGHVPTEAIREILGEDSAVFQMQLEHGTPAEVPAAMLVFLLTTEEGRARSGETFLAPDFCAKRKLVPGWPR
ncbi:MAG TPA: SDR family oxidoreductase [Myxococcales bacterium]|nr:SDR family oxidoreductase [Myxococcales bacterium]HIM03567.1 SDR family oxidoreductase [Myxococcales bacterium]